METYTDMAQMLDLANKNIRKAIFNMIKDLQEKMTSVSEEIGNHGRQMETKRK